MTKYRARVVIERIELSRPILRGNEVPKEAIYNEVRIEVTTTDPDVALSKVIGLARAEQADRDARKLMPQPAKLPSFDDDEEEEEN